MCKPGATTVQNLPSLFVGSMTPRTCPPSDQLGLATGKNKRLVLVSTQLGQITRPGFIIGQKLVDLKMARIITYGKWSLFEYLSLHVHNQLLQFVIPIFTKKGPYMNQYSCKYSI